MKTIITSNWRPLHRALCTLLLCIAALGAMPRSASAQLTTVGEYNATTGAVINASFITGLSGPIGLALSGNNLFVSSSVGFPGPGSPGTVGEYDATTGAAINANLITGLSSPLGLALSGNKLFVADNGHNVVGEYNATTGAAINANFITGLFDPDALAVASVPEPSPWSMIAVGGVALLGIMHRKRHRTA